MKVPFSQFRLTLGLILLFSLAFSPVLPVVQAAQPEALPNRQPDANPSAATSDPTVAVSAPAASQDDNVRWTELGHDSRNTLYRTPGGAVPTGTPVTLRLRAASGDLTGARVRLWNDRLDTQTILNMSLAANDGTYEYWQATVPASDDPTVYWYRFIAVDGTDTDYYEDDGERTGGWGQAYDESIDYSWQITVYDPAFETPDWVKNAIIYQVFPDRFRDGNPSNDPAAGTFFYGLEGAGGSILRSNGVNWNTAVCDPRDSSGACPGVWSQNFYGGDLKGLTDKLDYLQDLGVTAIYLNPVFFSPSNHGYDTTDYLQIDSSLSTQAEFEAFASQAHARGMHIILDGVFNHTSSDSVYFDRYGRYDSLGACESADSPYRDWYSFQPVADGSGPCVGDDGTPGGATYTSWYGYDSLPKLNASNAGVRALIWDSAESVAVHWLQWADGWRLDVGGDVDPGVTGDPNNLYWEGFRAAVKAAKPDAYIVGEEWGNASSWVLGGEWDATMNYQFGSALLSFWRDETLVDNDHNPGSAAGALSPLTPQQLNERLLNLQERYPAEAFAAMLNLLDSHDTNRALLLLDENADEAETTPATYQNANYDWSDAITRLKGAALLQMTLPGAPTIYYGDEVGLVGPVNRDVSGWQDDPYNRQPFPWLDESGTPFYTHLQTTDAQANLRLYYQRLISARNAHPALRTGDFHPLLIDNTNNVYAFGRKLADNSDAALVLINRANSAQSVSVDVSAYFSEGATFQDVSGGLNFTVTNGHITAQNLPARAGVLMTLTGSMPASPAAVTNLSIVGEGVGSINLAWTAVSGATSYDIYRSLVSGGGYSFVTNLTGTGFTDSGLTNAVTYHYVVVSRNDATGLVSGYSNEVAGMPQLAIDWANIQWPSSITHTIGTTPTENIYGQVWINGITAAPGATPGLRAQVGYGPDGSSPDGNAAWQWVEAVFSVLYPGGNNDEFVASLTPETVGTFDYAYRYSGNNGQTWVYADLDGTANGYDPAQAGALVVNASTDSEAPAAPLLSITDWSDSFIALGWTAATDNVGVHAYDLYRSTDPALAGNRVARVLAPDLTYVDNSVTSGVLYYYRVLAVDTSFNCSALSNQVSQTAEAKMVAVTFTVSVPSFTVGTVYLSGNQPTMGNWTPDAVPMTQVDATHWTITLDFLDGTSLVYKFTRGSWDTVMKGLDGNLEIAGLETGVEYSTDGTQLVEYGVLNWRDPLVTGFSPANGAQGVGADSVVTVTWSQSMAVNTCLTLTGPDGAVAGTCSYDDASRTTTFTPGQPLAGGATYTVTVSGQPDIANDGQQVPVSWSFETGLNRVFLPLVLR
ncbi:glycosidase [Longilinea arvoryzae]|uniref:Glycosidase n=1 Tax=Longilinea arvoryzae TaxID=360412 RepID=A0A0S7B649_9CHLR|nr:alpha-amylase family glycosyl hydrolase [Longilinea arvoryzae]GAP12334.1 glycosidase [Longilinea arvoryzae]